MFFSSLEYVNQLLWTCLGVPLILLFGAYLTYISGFMLIKNCSRIWHIFLDAFSNTSDTHLEKGISPIRTFFASVSGCIGLENVVSVCAASNWRSGSTSMDVGCYYFRNAYKICRNLYKFCSPGR